MFILISIFLGYEGGIGSVGLGLWALIPADYADVISRRFRRFYFTQIPQISQILYLEDN